MSSLILDQFGRPYGSSSGRPARSANLGGGERPSESFNLKDIDKLVPRHDRRVLVSASKTLFLNSQPLIGAIEQKAMYSVGNAWLPIYLGKDPTWGSRAVEWLIDEWYPICNVAGGVSDFQSDLYSASVGMDRDGEWFEWTTATPSGYPQIQLIPSHRIDAGGLPEGRLMDGRFAEDRFWHEDGIVYYRDTMKPVAYSYCDDKGKHEKWLDAAFMDHQFDKAWPEQKRGLPLFYHSLNGLRDILQSEEWERRTLLIMSRLSMVIENQSGGPEQDEPSYVAPTSCGEKAATYLQGGEIMYFQAGAQEKITQVKNDRPGNPWMDFNDYQIRLACTGINWPTSMLWKASGQGTAERNDIGKAVRSVEDRQTIIHKIAKRRVTKALAWAMDNGRLPKVADFYKIGFTKPKSLTIDDGRTSKESLEKFRAGIRNATDLIGEEGKSFEEVLNQRKNEIIAREKAADEIEKEIGRAFDRRQLLLITPNEQQPQEAKEDENNQS